jgi:UDP-GlcNAc3NAcA epimerase
VKILTVLGARPQFVKASVVSHALAQTGECDEIVVHTGQHFDANMSKVFFAELGMATPNYELDIHGGTHGAMTGRMLVEVEQVLLKERPRIVLVYGDTNSTLAGSLAAAKLQIPVAHIEAGLRSFEFSMPEEVNRILTDRISDWLFTPTIAAAENLRREGVPTSRVIPVGDVMYDVAMHYGDRVSPTRHEIDRLGLTQHGYVLVTIHRAENTDNPERLRTIVTALNSLSRDVEVVWPMHPRTRGALAGTRDLNMLLNKVRLIEPVSYLSMVQLEKYSAVIATDSGGVQKEAFFHRVPCVTVRFQTEWVELVEAGWNLLAPPVDAPRIENAIRMSIGRKGRDVSPYGNGDAAVLIAAHLVRSAK